MTVRTPFLLSQAVDQSADRLSDHPAFECEGDILVYQDLARRSNQLAHALMEQGVRRGDRVGIWRNKGLDTAIAIFGILKTGAAYVPIDPMAPVERVAFILRDADIKCLISGNPHRGKLLELLRLECPVECVVGADDLDGRTRCLSWAAVDGYQEGNPGVRMTEMDLAYIMYTSGSTGTPKGLMHTHGSGLAYARLSARTFGVTNSDRLGNHAPLHFDISTFEYFVAPLCGATTVIVTEETALFPAAVADLIEESRLTFWYSVPLALIRMLEAGVIDGRDMGALRWVKFGGEPFPPKHLRRLMELWPHARFSNIYGPAEVNQCTYFHVPAAYDFSMPVPIGAPWENTDIAIVDENDNPVPPGSQGELLVRSPTMMLGYWNRPDLNARAFYDREPVNGLRQRYYRTGDIVRTDDGGLLHFVGRKDRQIKMRGFRLELDEVENVLAASPGVSEAAVVALRAADGTVNRLAAAILLGEQSVSSAQALEAIRSFAVRRLPGYSLPEQIEILAEFPRTGTGKCDRKRIEECLASSVQSVAASSTRLPT
ncbi:MAG: amino acid adenylation domain-containing protein [Verrucomicrobiales bacterium]